MVRDSVKATYDRAANTESFQEEQLVLLYNPQRKKVLSTKLQTSCDGPYKKIKRFNNVLYWIQKANRSRTNKKVVHIVMKLKYNN